MTCNLWGSTESESEREREREREHSTAARQNQTMTYNYRTADSILETEKNNDRLASKEIMLTEEEFAEELFFRFVILCNFERMFSVCLLYTSRCV